MKNKNIKLLVEMQVKQECIEELIRIFNEEFIPRSQKESGCLFYELWQSNKEPHRITVVESWESQKHLDDHIAQEWFKAFFPKVEAMQAVPTNIRFLSSAENAN